MVSYPSTVFDDPDAFGFQMWTASPLQAYANFALTNGTFNVAIAVARRSVTIAKLGTWVEAGAVTPGAGVNQLAIYSCNNTGAACTLLGNTGDMTTAFESAGFAEAALVSGVAVVAGTPYYLACLTSYTGTEPTIQGFTTPPNGPPLMNGFLGSGFVTGKLALPASFLVSQLTTDSGVLFETAR